MQTVGLGRRLMVDVGQCTSSQTDLSLSSWKPHEMRPKRSSSNTSYRVFETRMGSRRRDEHKLRNDGSRARRRKNMPSAEKRQYMTRAVALKILKNSEVDKFAGDEKSGDAE